MAGIGTYIEHFFNAGGTISTSAPSPSTISPWRIADTSAAGTPVYTAGYDNGSSSGIGHFARLQLAANNEVENVCLYWGDVLSISIEELKLVDIIIRGGQSAINSATSFAFGLGSDRNDTLDNVAANLWFRMEGGTSTTAVYYESDDGTTDSDDNATGQTLTTGWKRARFDFRNGTSLIQPSFTNANGVLTPTPTTLNMSAYSGCLQPYFQLQKGSGTQTDYFDICMWMHKFSEQA